MGGRGGSSGLAPKSEIRKPYEPNVSQMQGSEKQIEWAKSILKKTSSLMNLIEEQNKEDARIDQLKEMHKTVISNMEKQKAKDIIEYFKGVSAGISGIPDMVKGQNNNYYRDFLYYVKKFEKDLRKSLRK